MQIVIDIPEDFYERVNEDGCMSYTDAEVVMYAFYRGKVLPKGHGRLIDADMVAEDIDTERVNLFMDGLKGTPRGYEHLKDLERIMDEIPTIIEADKEADE